jgi:hypothetical protein
MIRIGAFIDGVMVDSVRVSNESEIPMAKSYLLTYYPEAQIYRQLAA